MSDSAGVRRESQAPTGADELTRLQREHAELWQWVGRLEGLAETGLQARGLAHDLGNLLTALMAGSELALQQDEPAEHVRTLGNNLQHAREAARRLHAFVQHTLLAAPRDEAGTPLSEVVEEALSFLAHPVHKTQVEVECEMAPPDRVRVPGGRAELLQVVGTALVTVLAGASQGNDVLLIHVEDGADEVGLRIERDGPEHTGADEDDWWARGSGLERTVARRIAASLGGRLDVRRGARAVSLHLPAVTRGGPRASWREPPSAFSRPRGGD